MHPIHCRTTLLVALLLAGPATAADLATGKALHDSACKTCHQPDIYTRKNSFIHTRDELIKQVTRCQQGARVHWSAAQIADVAAYLNANYYKFK